MGRRALLADGRRTGRTGFSAALRRRDRPSSRARTGGLHHRQQGILGPDVRGLERRAHSQARDRRHRRADADATAAIARASGGSPMSAPAAAASLSALAVEYRRARIVATDVSNDALVVARRNVGRHGVERSRHRGSRRRARHNSPGLSI